MLPKKFCLLIVPNLLFFQIVAAQEFEFQRDIEPFPVIVPQAKGPEEELAFPFLGGFNAPRLQFVDIDADGDFDLFVGEFLGNINFYRNEGSASAHQFVQDTTHYFDTDVGLHVAPKFIDLDKDGDQDVIVGSDDNGLFWYKNEGSANAANFILDTGFDLNVTDRPAPAFSDIDNDSDPDLFVASKRGGLFYYENRENVTSVEPETPQTSIPQVFALQQNYPNPFNPETRISYELPTQANVKINIYNVIGQVIRTLVVATQAAGKYVVECGTATITPGEPCHPACTSTKSAPRDLWRQSACFC
ncbi:T9SS type A sorting domain-containing protein [candidate division KSB1 bacterium]|nr:T9SS type A sorting domain-containing protein [candidate division KSB1 bacterium]NIS22481.1 T9SS type A sorting domain-containing protein [candidate division KSB1 bacterium]NIT69329.1 T9SS type A sorting domain-containing protein [candidate division KSB1 bacterium]NIU22986.1 T9SS type A sorting domain-containing protein [candidate division KSB1 bacterium]NIU89235.1 hypothetical protein [candidate division KSB1 bacterium]